MPDRSHEDAAGACPMTSFWPLVEWRAAATPDAVAADDERDRELTFGQLRDGAEAVAAGLYERGVREGAAVAWQLPTTLDAIVVLTALARLGAVQVPLVPILRTRDLTHIVRATGARHLLVPSSWRNVDYGAQARAVAEAVAATDPTHVVTVLVTDDVVGDLAGDVAQLPPAAPAPACAADAPVRWLFFTSGTTSEPKGTRHSDATVIACGHGMNQRFGTTPADRNSLVFPVAHIGGPTSLAGGLLGGYRHVLVESFSGAASCRDLGRRHVTLIGGGPAFWSALVDAQRADPATPVAPDLRALLGGGAPKPPTIHDAVTETLGVPLATGYGSTECPAAFHSGPHDDEETRRTDGYPLQGVEARIVRVSGPDAGTLAEVGEVGEIQLRGTLAFLGYLDPRHEVGVFDDGWFRSSDLGRLDAQGRLRVTGRLKDIIIRKGENISAKEIEDVLVTHPAVRDVACIGLLDTDRGERCCAVVVCRDPTQPPDLAALVAHCVARGVTIQRIPEQLEIVHEIPRNPTGKVLKHELQARFHDPDRLGATTPEGIRR